MDELENKLWYKGVMPSEKLIDALKDLIEDIEASDAEFYKVDINVEEE